MKQEHGEQIKLPWKMERQIEVNVYNLRDLGVELFGGRWVEPYAIDVWSNGSETLHIESDYRAYVAEMPQIFPDKVLNKWALAVAEQRKAFLALSPEEQQDARSTLSGKYLEWIKEEENAGY